MFRVKVPEGEIAYSFSHMRGIQLFVNGKLITDITNCNLEYNQFRFLGSAACSHLDTFNKEKGRKVALARALDNIHISKSSRKLVWNSYFERAAK